MPLDRTWYNTLVDDDGVSAVGTVWNKASVDHIYDDVDAQLPTTGTFTPALGGSVSGEATYAIRTGSWVKTGPMVHLGGRIVLTSLGSSSGSLVLTNLPFPIAQVASQTGIAVGYFAGLGIAVSSLALYTNPGLGNNFYFATVPAAGGTGTGVLSVAQTGAAFEFVFGGWYRAVT